MSTETSTTDTGTTEDAGAPPDSVPPAPEPTAEQASSDQAAPAADSGQDTAEAPAGEDSDDQDDAQDQDDGDGEDDGASAGDGPGREAAKYRRRLRDVEAERDALKATVAALQRAEVDRLATADGLKPAALWSSAELTDLLAEDGTVDQGMVAAAIAAARETLGIAPPPPPRGNFVKKEGATLRRPGRPSGRDAMVGVVMGRDGSDG